MNTNFIEVKQRYNLTISHPAIKNSFDFKLILSEKIIELEKRLDSLNEIYGKQLDDNITSALISKLFSYSKTASNGLNFLTKDEESNLCKKEQSEDILDFFRIIYIVLNENYSDIPNNKLIENLFSNVLPKLKVENLSK